MNLLRSIGRLSIQMGVADLGDFQSGTVETCVQYNRTHDSLANPNDRTERLPKEMDA